jgi:hypothetical protein
VNVNCDTAKRRYFEVSLWFKRWNYLIFFLGIVVVLFLCISIALAAQQNWVPGAVTTVGTILTGTATGWVLSRRNQVGTEANEAFNDVMKYCQDVQVAAAVRELQVAAVVRELQIAANNSVIPNRAAREMVQQVLPTEDG